MTIDLEHARGALEYTLIHVRFRNGRSVVVRLDEAVPAIFDAPGMPAFVQITDEAGARLLASATID